MLCGHGARSEGQSGDEGVVELLPRRHWLRRSLLWMQIRRVDTAIADSACMPDVTHALFAIDCDVVAPAPPHEAWAPEGPDIPRAGSIAMRSAYGLSSLSKLRPVQGVCRTATACAGSLENCNGHDAVDRCGAARRMFGGGSCARGWRGVPTACSQAATAGSGFPWAACAGDSLMQAELKSGV